MLTCAYNRMLKKNGHLKEPTTMTLTDKGWAAQVPPGNIPYLMLGI